MFLTAFVLVVLGVAVTLAGARLTFSALRLDPLETLLWLGLAETPAPPVPRRRPEHGGRRRSAPRRLDSRRADARRAGQRRAQHPGVAGGRQA